MTWENIEPKKVASKKITKKAPVDATLSSTVHSEKNPQRVVLTIRKEVKWLQKGDKVKVQLGKASNNGFFRLILDPAGPFTVNTTTQNPNIKYVILPSIPGMSGDRHEAEPISAEILNNEIIFSLPNWVAN